MNWPSILDLYSVGWIAVYIVGYGGSDPSRSDRNRRALNIQILISHLNSTWSNYSRGLNSNRYRYFH